MSDTFEMEVGHLVRLRGSFGGTVQLKVNKITRIDADDQTMVNCIGVRDNSFLYNIDIEARLLELDPSQDSAARYHEGLTKIID